MGAQSPLFLRSSLGRGEDLETVLVSGKAGAHGRSISVASCTVLEGRPWAHRGSRELSSSQLVPKDGRRTAIWPNMPHRENTWKGLIQVNSAVSSFLLFFPDILDTNVLNGKYI